MSTGCVIVVAAITDVEPAIHRLISSTRNDCGASVLDDALGDGRAAAIAEKKLCVLMLLLMLLV